ncbi:MAG TPA: hypothetical protein VF173_35690 [Thermoanaerobaculia bacterium]|nr:hypothetical protein [Thermoanaerobaculia bacterium]
MKKKLALHRETLRRLDDLGAAGLRKVDAGVAAASGAPCYQCLSYEVCIPSEPSLCVICYESTRSPAGAG